MATALFINRTDLVRNSIIDGNVDTDKFIQFIKLAQNAKYKTLLNTYLQPMLIWAAQVYYIPFAAYSIKNGGVFKHRSETSDTVSKNEVDYLVDKAREFMEYYSRRFIDFMAFNQSDYPEYTSNTNDDIYPDYDALFNGWVL